MNSEWILKVFKKKTLRKTEQQYRNTVTKRYFCIKLEVWHWSIRVQLQKQISGQNQGELIVFDSMILLFIYLVHRAIGWLI